MLLCLVVVVVVGFFYLFVPGLPLSCLFPSICSFQQRYHLAPVVMVGQYYENFLISCLVVIVSMYLTW